ncbi:MAG: VTT domain-containing protein [Oscillospiraceae bacterium]|nr:VTT domain-containing protein [Oscillospiraceae bacterium]
MKRKTILSILFVVIMVGLLVLMAADLYPLIKGVITSTDDEHGMASYISSYGARGVPILLCLGALQIIIAFIPSAAIQLLTGLCYGVWLGAAINLGGCILGNIFIIVAIRQLKNVFAPFTRKKAAKAEGDTGATEASAGAGEASPQPQSKRRRVRNALSLERLSKVKRPEMIAFCFFLIPGIPNGFVPYVFATTDIPLRKYIPAVAAGCVPSTFMCVIVGDRLRAGDKATVIVMAAIIIAVMAVVLIFKNRILAFIFGENAKSGEEARRS